MNFSIFFAEAEEEEKNVLDMLSKLPEKHRNLVRGFKFKYIDGNTLNGDNKHIGVIEKDRITIAAPWRYGREFVTLHEIGHIVYEKLCSKKWKEEWKKAVKKNSLSEQDNDEEDWCMCYANYFAKHKILTYNHPAWKDYMSKFCKETGS